MIGIGVDLVEIDRFRHALERTPALMERIFTEAERAYSLRRRDPTERFAVRFAAKEAVMKAMGVGIGQVRLQDIEVDRAAGGQPSVVLHGTAAQRAAALGIVEWKLTMTHTERSAEAIAVALGPR
jgi:holo-[acyl-carrier protein] synthase